MKQIGFSALEFANKKKKTKKEIFLAKMETVVPFDLCLDIIRPFYAKKGNGRPPLELEKVFRMYLVSQWYNTSDEGTEDMVYEIQSIRDFVGVDLACENAPDSTTLCKFRHLLEKNNITSKIFEEINLHLIDDGIMLKAGTIVDATIIAAPSSTRNKSKSRDSEMSSTRKNNNFHFGMKSHIGVDSNSGLVHTHSTTTAKNSDVNEAHNVIHGEERKVYGDSGYLDMDNKAKVCEKYQDTVNPEKIIYKDKQKKKHIIDKKREDIDFYINRRRMQIEKVEDADLKTQLKAEEKAKSQVRAKVEYPFRIIKRIFGFTKTRYKGLSKNNSKLSMLYALVNIYFCCQLGYKLNQTRGNSTLFVKTT